MWATVFSILAHPYQVDTDKVLSALEEKSKDVVKSEFGIFVEDIKKTDNSSDESKINYLVNLVNSKKGFKSLQDIVSSMRNIPSKSE